MAITFQFQEHTPLSNRLALKKYLENLLINEGKKPGNISIVFCSDEYLLDINIRFLSHDYYTDIITFDLKSSLPEVIDAELMISIDRVKENAKTFNQTLFKELHRVIFHGLLHLAGYEDKTPKQKEVMRIKEEYYLKTYFDVPRNTVS
jgi:rRNA maturation RNase YbeY